MNDVIFDLDDFAEQSERNCIDQLLFLKKKFPNLKVTLFAIPHYAGKDQQNYFSKIKDMYGDWIQLGIHGWDHHDNFECSKWNYTTAIEHILEAKAWGCFEPLFKAPGWQISRETYKACKDLGLIVADHKFSAYTEPGVPNSTRRPVGLKVYEIDHPWMVHGHTWNCVGNGIEELITKWEVEGYPFDQKTHFHWIEEVV